jgi:cytochrome P450
MTVATPDRSLDERLDAWLAADPSAIADPYSLFEDIRAQGRVVTHSGAAFLTHYEDVKAVIRGDERFSRQAMSRGSRALELRASLAPEQQAAFDEVSAIQENFISRTDGERHMRLRMIIHRVFTPKRVAAMEPAIQRFVDRLIESQLNNSRPDFEGLAYGLPLWVVCELLGAPERDRDMIHQWSLDVGANHGGVNAERLMAAHRAHKAFDAYVEDMIERHKREPGSAGELVAALLDAEEGDRLTPEELSATFVVLLFAGHETTTNLLGQGLRELLVRRDVWQGLVEDRNLLPNTIEELLRYVTPVQFLFRYTVVEDAIVGGTLIPKGMTVYPLLPAANRDPEVFDDPQTLDIRRENARDHVSLGFGPYFCLGASLARLEATRAFDTLLTRFPRLELNEETTPEFTGSAMLRKLVTIPVVLEP